MGARFLVIAFGLLLLPARAADLLLLAPTNHAMPLLGLKDGRAETGIIKDLGDELARRMGRRAVHLTLPSKRVPEALRKGEGDLLCYLMPGWVDGDFYWTQPVIPDAELVVASRDEEPLRSPQALSNKPVGTVLGYRYPLESILGPAFQRADASTMAANLRKLELGRVRYAITTQIALDHYQRTHPQARLHTVWELWRFHARCAMSKRSTVSPVEVNAVLDDMLKSGAVEAILRRYR